MREGFQQANAGLARQAVPNGAGDLWVRMEDAVDRQRVGGAQLDQRLGDGAQAAAPAFAAVAGDEQLRAGALAQDERGERGLGGANGVDPAVPGDEDCARDALRGEVGRGALGRREEQRGTGVDRGAIALLGPGGGGVPGAKPRLDMGDGNAAIEARLRRAERARRIALNDEQSGRGQEVATERAPNSRDMSVGLRQARAAELDARQMIEAVVGEVEAGVLPGADDEAVEPARGERGGNGGQLDGFGPGADDEPDCSATQPSP